MPAYKDSKTGTWFVKFYCKDWTGENKQIKKRGFATKREALDYERNYKIRQENNLDMTFGEFWKLYTEDVKNYVKLNTWLTKEHIVDTKILPYFKNLKMNEITPGDVRKWQNEMVAFRYENGKCYSQTYKKTMHNILSAIFNHACRFYNLKSNPARQAGNMGREEKKEMLFWTTEEYKKFSEAVIDKPVSFYAFEMLYWTGMRLGELLALTMEDFDFEKNTVRINKSYQRLQGQDVITTPKTPKSNRTIKLPKFLAEEMQEYFAMLYDQTPTDRIFLVTKSFLHHEMERGCKLSGVKKIRIHDLRHSHISHLIDLGFSAVAIADRVGHESIDITYRYSHLFPSKQVAMADRLDAVNASFEDCEEQDDDVEIMQTEETEPIGIPEVHNSSDVNVARMDESTTDVTGKSEFVETKETEPVDKVGWIVRRISELGGYENISDSVKADVFGFDIADVSGSIRLFSDVMKRLGIKKDGDELYEEFQRIYDERVSRDTNTEKAKDKIWDMRR